MMQHLSRIALGTVQFGMAYGVANAGQVRREDASAILDHAWKSGIRALDTAAAYGESETVLGEIGVAEWTLTSKLPPVPEDSEVEGWLRTAAESSLRRLRVPRIHAILLHSPDQLLSSRGESIYRALAKLREEGLVSRIGISAVRAEDAIELFSRYDLNAVQAAMNVLDRRFESSRHCLSLDNGQASGRGTRSRCAEG